MKPMVLGSRILATMLLLFSGSSCVSAMDTESLVDREIDRGRDREHSEIERPTDSDSIEEQAEHERLEREREEQAERERLEREREEQAERVRLEREREEQAERERLEREREEQAERERLEREREEQAERERLEREREEQAERERLERELSEARRARQRFEREWELYQRQRDLYFEEIARQEREERLEVDDPQRSTFWRREAENRYGKSASVVYPGGELFIVRNDNRLQLHGDQTVSSVSSRNSTSPENLEQEILKNEGNYMILYYQGGEYRPVRIRIGRDEFRILNLYSNGHELMRFDLEDVRDGNFMIHAVESLQFE